MLFHHKHEYESSQVFIWIKSAQENMRILYTSFMDHTNTEQAQYIKFITFSLMQNRTSLSSFSTY